MDQACTVVQVQSLCILQMYQFTAKIQVKVKPATKERWGTNPFTGEKMKFKAKPKRYVVKIRPLKQLKEWAA